MGAEQPDRRRRRYELRGEVQGVGLRPCVYRLARAHELAGEVANDANGAAIEVEGPPAAVEAFGAALTASLPPLARVTELTALDVPVRGGRSFAIKASRRAGAVRAQVTPDAATCADCVRELFDPADRRHRYPLINCTNCGPRYSIIHSVPYDRPATTMSGFALCAACGREYGDPGDRRFHAQPTACAACGPALQLVDAAGALVAGDPVAEVAGLLSAGAIVAVKGIGGFHLACRADREEVVQRLRDRKLRDGKPVAVMVADLAMARRVTALTPAEEAALRSPAAPIVLVPRTCQDVAPGALPLAAGVAAGCPTVGLMLAYTPVHHLLFAAGLGPLVMTSGNLSGEPLAYRDGDARQQLADVADAFLVHNRPICRPIDDSVVQVFRGSAVPVRRARGYVPQPIRIERALDLASSRRDSAKLIAPSVLAVGAELKSTVCLLRGGEAIVSEHLGDLTCPAAYRHFEQAIDRLEQLFEFTPTCIAHDLHPAYASTAYARRRGLPTCAVQHHHAHAASLLAEWDEPGPIVAVVADGAGYGQDGAVWGGELLVADVASYRRAGHLRPFPLLGGDAAALDTWRPAAALLLDAFGDDWLTQWRRLRAEKERGVPGADELAQLVSAKRRHVPTTSLGRVFDAVAFVLGLRVRNRHEAEAALAVEAAAGPAPGGAEAYPFELCEGVEAAGFELDWRPTVRAIVADVVAGVVPAGKLAARFHETASAALAAGAERVCGEVGLRTVGLTGGCFANRRLLGRVVERLESAGRRVLYHRRVPCGDGGVALGQAVVAAARQRREA